MRPRRTALPGKLPLSPASIGTLLARAGGRLAVANARRTLKASDPVLPESTAAIIPPAVPGSLGDAAMISAAIAELRRRGFRRVDLFHDDAWPLDEAVDRRVASSRFFYENSAHQQAMLIRQTSRYSHMFFIGADVIDGAYNPGSVCRRLSLLDEAAAAGRQATVLGASYNEMPDRMTEAALKRLRDDVTICARDALSRARLQQRTSRPIRQTADLAFMLTPRPAHPDAVAACTWIRTRRAHGGPVVALAANYLQAATQPGLRDALREYVHALTSRGWSILLVPHDTRTAEPDAALLRYAAAALAPGQLPRTYLMETPSPGAIKAALAETDLLVTGRLHALILAMGSGTPGIGLAYQNKFEGTLAHFKLDDEADLLTTPEAFARQPWLLVEQSMRVLARSAELRARIVAELPQVRSASARNFAS